ncbi:MAG: UDP-glucose 4-epimerase, partial [Mycobacterium sp.]|nr:UDP-glucose 4-epimerase [Mycobacterium sp.]
HEQDALGALERAVMVGHAGTFNSGASGILMLAQAIRRAGRVALPVPGFGLWVLDSLRRANRYAEINRVQLDYLSYGRVMDTTRMRREVDNHPKWTTADAFDDNVRGRGLTPIIDPEWVRSIEGRAVVAAQRFGGRTKIN